MASTFGPVWLYTHSLIQILGSLKVLKISSRQSTTAKMFTVYPCLCWETHLKHMFGKMELFPQNWANAMAAKRGAGWRREKMRILKGKELIMENLAAHTHPFTSSWEILNPFWNPDVKRRNHFWGDELLVIRIVVCALGSKALTLKIDGWNTYFLVPILQSQCHTRIILELYCS